MNVTDYTYLINKPDAITEKQAEALGSVLNEFPYFQSARALRLKGLYNQNSFKYNYALKVAAAYTTDRSILFDFITSETFTTIQGEYYDRKLRDLLEIKVFDSEIISPEEIKKVTEVRIDPIEQSILDSIKEATTVSFEAPVKIEEKPIDPAIEQSILTSIKEATPIIEEKSIIEENPIAETTPVIDAPIIKEPTPTFFEEIVDDESPYIRVDPIEESIFTSIKEASTVVFEEANTAEEKLIEEVKDVEEPKAIEVQETIKQAEENLEIGRPLDFSANEKHSFQEWLQLSRTEPIDRTKEAPKEIESEKTVQKVTETKVEAVEAKAETEIVDEEKKKKAEIINKFIETNPKISPIKQTAIIPAVQFDINKEDNSYLMTETLARVYLEQKKYTKAIQAYEILILKYPEKISFFADRISDIKILQQNNNNN
jgi:tetratricopeptide (TPR) repeat protein